MCPLRPMSFPGVFTYTRLLGGHHCPAQRDRACAGTSIRRPRGEVPNQAEWPQSQACQVCCVALATSSYRKATAGMVPKHTRKHQGASLRRLGQPKLSAEPCGSCWWLASLTCTPATASLVPLWAAGTCDHFPQASSQSMSQWLALDAAGGEGAAWSQERRGVAATGLWDRDPEPFRHV